VGSEMCIRDSSYRVQSDAGVLAFSGDTAAHDGLARLCDGAALFVCEATFGSGDDARMSAASAKHLCVDDVRALRPSWSPAGVHLTHLSAAARESLAASPIPGCHVAVDGDRWSPPDGARKAV